MEIKSRQNHEKMRKNILLPKKKKIEYPEWKKIDKPLLLCFIYENCVDNIFTCFIAKFILFDQLKYLYKFFSIQCFYVLYI